jgi:V8-like Glu-specific endopeptidase
VYGVPSGWRDWAADGEGVEHTSVERPTADATDGGGSQGDAPAEASEAWFADVLSGEDGHPEQALLASEAVHPVLAQEGVSSASYPWSSVVLLSLAFPNGFLSYGSGVMVGRNDVLTAGHMVYNPAWGGLASAVVVTPAYVPGRGFDGPYGSSDAWVSVADLDFDPERDRLVPPGNGGPGLAGSERDVAFLTLKAPLGDQTGWMRLDPGFKEGYANLSGYPAAFGYRLTNDTAWAYDDAVDSYTNIGYFEARPGNSGGPVWHYGPDGAPAVVGLVSSGHGGNRGFAAFDIATSYASILGWIASNDHLIA